MWSVKKDSRYSFTVSDFSKNIQFTYRQHFKFYAMKKTILSLFATILFAFTGNAQNNYLKSSMVILVSQAKSNFTKGMTYKDWVIRQTGNQTVSTAQEDKFLKDVFGFLSTNEKPDVIYKNYDGSSIIELRKLYDKGGLTSLGPTNARCGFFCQLIIWVFMPEFNDILILMP
jgi:hypothetical protein